MWLGSVQAGAVLDGDCQHGLSSHRHHRRRRGLDLPDARRLQRRRQADLVFQNDATRAEQLWQMNGAGILENSQMALITEGWHLVL
jgi:hypothetical protein